MSEIAIKHFGDVGYVKDGTQTFTFQLGERTQPEFSKPVSSPEYESFLPVLRSGNYRILSYGQNNLEPNEVKEMISRNRLLPELIEKQIRMLYGQGPTLFIVKTSGREVSREFCQDPEIMEWLESWKESGLQDNYKTYLNKCIRAFYFDEGIFTRWRFNKSRRVNGSLPVAGLEHLSSTRCRFASKFEVDPYNYEDRDFQLILFGDWQFAAPINFKVYPRFDFTNPFAFGSCINYAKNPSQGEEVYAFNKFYRGIKEWIKGSNLTPRYINDYLENAFSARLHVIIPYTWVESKRQMLQDLCEKNAELEEAGKKLLTVKFGEEEVLEIGTDFNENILNKYINMELARFSRFLSGAGKNQGKIYSSYSYMTADGKQDRWTIEEVPQKYKEYIEGLTSYDKRADEVMLSAKGIDSSISNISKDGVISKSGADAYYNYMIYLSNLAIPEEVVTSDINYAIKLNFPEKYRQGFRVGFYRPVVHRQQEVSPADRPTNNQQP